MFCDSLQWVIDGASRCGVEKARLHGRGQSAKLSSTQLGSKRLGLLVGGEWPGQLWDGEDFYQVFFPGWFYWECATSRVSGIGAGRRLCSYEGRHALRGGVAWGSGGIVRPSLRGWGNVTG